MRLTPLLLLLLLLRTMVDVVGNAPMGGGPLEANF